MANLKFTPLSLSDINSSSGLGWTEAGKDLNSTQPPAMAPKPDSLTKQMSPVSRKPKQRIPSSFTSSYKIHELLMASSSHNETLSATLLAALDRWLVCIMLVQFDVEIGPDMKIIQPAVQFTEEDFRAICFSALPEKAMNNSKETRSQFHSFRFESTTFPGTDLMGYALFSQQKAPNTFRGYVQESLVIISRLDYPQLFNACLQLMVDVVDHNLEFNTTVQDENDQIYSQVRRRIHDKDGFEDDSSSILKRKYPTASASQMLDEKLPVIHTAISNISQWPDPDPNSTLELGFLGTIINLSIPLYMSMPLLGTVDLDTTSVNFHRSANGKHTSKFSASTSDLSSFSCDPRLYLPHSAPVITATEPSTNWDYMINFLPNASDLYILYEYMLLAKPIVVYASTPHHCSTFISLLVDLIRPVPYAGRIREYVTIHTCPNDLDSGITGVTNPFLVRGVQDPNTLVIVLSSTSTSGSNKRGSGLISAPFQYYRTYHNGVGVLRRQATLRHTQSIDGDIALTSPVEKEKPDVVMTNAPALAVPARQPQAQQQQQQSSWTSKLFSRYIPAFGPTDRLKHRKIDKSGISKPITATFQKLPTSFNTYTANITKTHKRTQSSASEVETEKANREEEANIKNQLKSARRSILKSRLLFPEQAFLASLARLISQAQAQAGKTGAPVAPEKSIDFAIRFHFATLTARFLGPLSCYLDPMDVGADQTGRISEDVEDQPKLAFAQSEFMHDLVSPTSSPRRRDSFRGRGLRRSLGVAGGSPTSVSRSGANSLAVSPSKSPSSSGGASSTLVRPTSPIPLGAGEPGLATTTVATAAADGSTSSTPGAAGHTASLLRNLSRKSLAGGQSSTSLVRSGDSLDAAMVGGTHSAGRSSMLSLSSLGLRFSASAASTPSNDAEGGDSSGSATVTGSTGSEDHDMYYRPTSPPALPLHPPLSPKRRTSKRFSGIFSAGTSSTDHHQHQNQPQNTEVELGEMSPATSKLGSTVTPTKTPVHATGVVTGSGSGSGSRKAQQQTADLHKQAIYKSFIESTNFTNWLRMNNVSSKA